MANPGTAPRASGAGGSASTRWIQLVAAIAAMVAIANLQYAWTLYVPEIERVHGWSRASIQTAFTIFVVFQTWLTPVGGSLLDRYGPRALMIVGGICAGLSWLLDAYASSLTAFYVAAIIGGIGAGTVYLTAANVAVVWFADRRGLAAGLVGAGFGGGSALTIIPIANLIKESGYQAAFFWFAFIISAVIIGAGLVIRAPRAGEAPEVTRPTQTRRNYTLGEAVRMPVFYVMFLIVTCVITGGLMAVAQLGLIAKDLGVKEMPVNAYFFTMAALPFALMMDRIVNGFSRPFFGWISDHIGRENTMFVAFGLEGLGILALSELGSNPWAFLLTSSVVFFAWGEIYSLFSAVTADTFGTKHYGKIYGLLYCSKGVGALLVPLSNVMMEASGSWTGVLYLTAGMNFVAAIAALLLLKPMLRKHHALSSEAPPIPTLVSRSAHA
ncbi:oxalate/formate MFS antiporter [Methylobacterium dankookense]|uniref:Oxalate:formate antiporter n=1 Tax=Methylobacterium dankookense TaxID=560405 RepID=A0A564FYI8_9HYPH|nr:oxalate/formate MFS antiporter [Methylobacterium dankookense]GJD55648.1 Oxalate:formate antiporter [Methylobacterium dankookense]VUF12798.1 Oxalate:formate antiporter [Methylobacterium dankookense]